MAEEPQTPLTADAAHPAALERVEAISDDIMQGTVRRSPKYAVFLVLGAALGVLVAAILTLAFYDPAHIADNGAVYSQGQIFGFLAVIGIVVGGFLGGVLAIILDRTVGRRTRTVRLNHETVETLD